MNSVLLISATWLHLLATVSVIGLYVIMYWTVTPAVIAKPEQTGLLIEVYRRSKALVLGGWVVFAVTGVALMLVNPAYHGVGRFDNPWSILMLAKHIVVLGMVLMTGFTNACPVIGMMRPLEAALVRENPDQLKATLNRLHTREGITMGLGLVVLLLTAFAALSGPG